MQPLSRILSANQHFCWAQTDSFLNFLLFAVTKLPIFWSHVKTKEGTLHYAIGVWVDCQG